MSDKVQLSDEEWRQQLSPERYAVTREAGTEPAFSGEYHDSEEPGIYACACCGQRLFSSEKKFDSGTGWPSFFAPISENAVSTETDSSYGMSRTEVLCSRCDAHLGHLFPDGPQPTGLRYCMNSLSIKHENVD